MTRLTTLKPVAAMAAALLVTTSAVGVLAQQPPTPGVAASRALAREQLALIDKALTDLNRLVQTGELPVSDPAFSRWGRRRLDALRTAGATKAEIVAALERYIETMRKEEATAQGMYQRGQATRVDVYDVQFRRMEAEIWLNQEKGR